MPSNPPSNKFAVLKVARGSANKIPSWIILILPIFSVTNILSSPKAIALGFSRLVASTSTESVPSIVVVGSGKGRGVPGEVIIIIEAIKAPTIPIILNFLFTKGWAFQFLLITFNFLIKRIYSTLLPLFQRGGEVRLL